MKREKIIYIGAVAFILLVVTFGIVMYMASKTGVKIENQVSNETQNIQNAESVSTEIGKTVEEQENEIQVEEPKLEETKLEEPNETTVKPSEADKSNNTNVQVTEKVTETKKEITFTKPAEGEIICEYAKDNLIYSETLKEWITHTAIDIKADKTSVVKASADGVIKSIVNDPRYGLTVVISHDEGYETVYSNLLTAEFVVVGEEVTQGQTIGTAGNTASFESSMESHIHFELLKDGEYLDPTIYLK